MKSQAYFFEEDNLDGEISENLKVWNRDCIGRDRDNYISLTC